MVNVGVLSLQGGVIEHINATKEASKGLGDAMAGLENSKLETKMAERGI